MVVELLRRQTHVGNDIRSTGLFGIPTRWPRNEINAGWWHWRRVTDGPWEHKDHINALELRLDFLALRWRLRVAANVGTRALQLIDSQVSLGALARGRSPSPNLFTLMERIAGLSLGGVIVQLLGYVITFFNPADDGSRRHWT